MGFSGVPPKPDVAVVLAGIDLWSLRADAALVLSEPPWDSLLAGWAADSLVRELHLGLVNYYRSKGHRIIVSVDPTNGLDRSSDAAPLVAAGRSLKEPSVQALYRAYVTAMDTILKPDYLAIASETNLVRAAAPPDLYAALVQVANDAYADVRAVDPAVRIFAVGPTGRSTTTCVAPAATFFDSTEATSWASLSTSSARSTRTSRSSTGHDACPRARATGSAQCTGWRAPVSAM